MGLGGILRRPCFYFTEEFSPLGRRKVRYRKQKSPKAVADDQGGGVKRQKGEKRRKKDSVLVSLPLWEKGRNLSRGQRQKRGGAKNIRGRESTPTGKRVFCKEEGNSA